MFKSNRIRSGVGIPSLFAQKRHALLAVFYVVQVDLQLRPLETIARENHVIVIVLD
jgi:hypothetical protein